MEEKAMEERRSGGSGSGGAKRANPWITVRTCSWVARCDCDDVVLAPPFPLRRPYNSALASRLMAAAATAAAAAPMVMEAAKIRI